MADIHARIRTVNPIAAAKVVAEIRREVDALETFPNRARRGAHANTRELIAMKHGYIVVYTVGPRSIDVISVFHAAQDRPRGG